MKRVLLSIILLFPIVFSFAQDAKEKKFGIKFTGFVKADIFYDTRQTVAVREGHFLLFPAPEMLDEDGNDINANGNFNILTIQTRLKGIISGPDALGAKTSGVIEGEFFGRSDGDINGFRLRHAFVRLDWEKSMLLVGQTWHPMFVTSCFPGTVSFNTGAPFLPFSRNPQIQYRFKAGPVNLYATAFMHLDFVANGPKGPSPVYLRNTGIPGFNAKVEYTTKNEDTGFEFLLGGSFNYKMITPQTSTGAGYKTTETANSYAANIYTKFVTKPVTVKLMGSIGQDVFDFTMIGGYAVSDSTDKEKGFVEYTPFQTMALWADIHTNGKKVQVGLFAAYSKNMGTVSDIGGAVYARGSNIDHAFRVAPRLILNFNKFRIAPEIEYDLAAYGTMMQDGTVSDTNPVSNFRFLLGVYYFF